MSKAILILDMPKSCLECKFGYMYGTFCDLMGDTYVTEGNKSEECPLKPMPQKKEVHTDFIGVGDYDFDDTYNAGYNACIDEILGEEE